RATRRCGPPCGRRSRRWLRPPAARYNGRCMPLERITILCFAASYSVALALELLQLFWPRPVYRWLTLGFGGAGLLAQALFLVVQRPPLSAPFGSLLLLTFVIAIFYLYGSLHHRHKAWGAIVLPVVV